KSEVRWLRSVTTAPGITAPLGSVTVPEIDPVTICAAAGAVANNVQNRTRSSVIEADFWKMALEGITTEIGRGLGLGIVASSNVEIATRPVTACDNDGNLASPNTRRGQYMKNRMDSIEEIYISLDETKVNHRAADRCLHKLRKRYINSPAGFQWQKHRFYPSKSWACGWAGFGANCSRKQLP